jgi:hypothetical protein
MRRMLMASLLAMVGVGLLMVAEPVAAGTEPSVKLTSRTVRAGEKIRAYGWGCAQHAELRVNLDDRPLKQGRTQQDGRFVAELAIPGNIASGRHWLSVRCDSQPIFRSEIYVFRFGMSASPRRVQPGTPITVSGRGCVTGTPVAIRLDGMMMATTEPNGHGHFGVTAPIPGQAKLNKPRVIHASCDGRLVGAVLVVPGGKPIPPKVNLLTMSRTVAPAGQTISVADDECSDLAPIVTLDDKPLPLALDQSEPGMGFKATVRIPPHTLPGRHRLSANCDGGRTGTAEISVLDSGETTSMGARQSFGPKPLGDVAIWVGLSSGLAVLLASLGIARRRP